MNIEAELDAYVRANGATDAQRAEFVDELDTLGLQLAMQPGVSVFAAADIADQTGLTETDVFAFRQAMGFATPSPDQMIGSARDVELFRTFADAASLFGMDAILGAARVVGTAMATIADAVTSAFLVNVEAPHREQTGVSDRSSPEMIEVAGVFVDRLSAALDVVLRRHLLAARRISEIDIVGGFEVQRSAVGFADIVGSTRLAEELPIAELGRLLERFESTARAIVTENGARTVKLIGDEVMFASVDVEVVTRIGVEIAAVVAAHPDLPAVRVGVAAGDTLLREGDLFGPTVNLAARLAGIAEPGTALVSAAVVLGPDFIRGEEERYRLAGIDEPVVASVVSLAAG